MRFIKGHSCLRESIKHICGQQHVFVDVLLVESVAVNDLTCHVTTMRTPVCRLVSFWFDVFIFFRAFPGQNEWTNSPFYAAPKANIGWLRHSSDDIFCYLFFLLLQNHSVRYPLSFAYKEPILSPAGVRKVKSLRYCVLRCEECMRRNDAKIQRPIDDDNIQPVPMGVWNFQCGITIASNTGLQKGISGTGERKVGVFRICKKFSNFKTIQWGPAFPT